MGEVDRLFVLTHDLRDTSLAETVGRLTAESAHALVAAVEAKDPYTRNHSLTVAEIAETLGRRMGLGPYLVETIRLAALLHDIGKIGIPDAILGKSGPLTNDEYDIIKTHPARAIEILRPLSHLSRTRRIILHHHERFDGGGYPAGLSGYRIPIGARILSVADAVDAMLSPRSYKEARDVDHVRRELAAGAGRQFDPVVAVTMLTWLKEETSVESLDQSGRIGPLAESPAPACAKFPGPARHAFPAGHLSPRSPQPTSVEDSMTQRQSGRRPTTTPDLKLIGAAKPR